MNLTAVPPTFWAFLIAMAAGYSVRKAGLLHAPSARRIMITVQKFATPWVLLLSFWGLSVDWVSIAALPFTGLGVILLQYGMALGAGSGAFLLLAMLLGGRVQAGASLTLTVSVAAALIASGAVLLATLHWYSLIALAMVPVLVRLPLPRGAIWMQAVVACVYAFVAAGGALAVAWLSARGWKL